MSSLNFGSKFEVKTYPFDSTGICDLISRESFSWKITDVCTEVFLDIFTRGSKYYQSLRCFGKAYLVSVTKQRLFVKSVTGADGGTDLLSAYRLSG